MFKDPIVEEVRKIRQQHAAKFNYDLDKIAKDLRIKQKKSGRKAISFPSKTSFQSESSSSSSEQVH